MAQEPLTPMMKQFHDMKATNPDAILLFRCGDFYETYSDDAVVASQILGITLTKRNQKGSSGSIAMAGFPHHALDNYLPRLIRAGHRVAICDQLEDPKLTKKLVKRGITELVTPGVALGDNVLASKENNFLAAIHFGAASVGLSLLDISTGEYLVAEGDVEYIDKLLAGFSPKEILVERGLKGKFDNLFAGKYFVFELDDWAFADVSARTKVLKHFDVKNLKGFGIDHLHAAITAAGAILTYLDQTQHHHTDHITRITRIEEERFVRLDKFTIRNLELVSTNHGDGRSLLQVLDRTLTPMGARQLRRWVLFPLRSVKDINTRLDSVEQFFRQPEFRELCEMELGKVGDLERIVSKVATGRINPREMQQLRAALETVMVLKNVCLSSPQESIRAIGEKLAPCTELRQRIERELRLDPPLLVNKGGVINEGVDAQLDELRNIQTSGKDYLLQIQEREIARTGIQSLKLGINKALWLFGVVQVVTILGFVWLAGFGRFDTITLTEQMMLAGVIGAEAVGVGLGTAAFVSYMARETNPAFTATQLALFTSLSAVPRTFINATTGYLIEWLGYVHFFWLCFILALPGMFLLLKVAPWGGDKPTN